MEIVDNYVSVWVGDHKFPPLKPEYDYGDDGTPLVAVEEVSSYMNVCREAATELVSQFINRTLTHVSDEVGSMTFDWMRCWNKTLYGEKLNPWRATKDQLFASVNQSAFYREAWEIDRKKIYNTYVANCTTDNLLKCKENAANQSLYDATGSEMCDINIGSSAWFWFTFMTTVGYGNQSSQTWQGRTMLGCIGFFSVIAWVMLLYVAGKVLGIIIDDLFRRLRCRTWAGDFQSVIVWGIIAGFWVAVVAMTYWFNLWWVDESIPNTWESIGHWLHGETETISAGGIELTEPGEAFWFAYISLLTVGFGDYYLIPEVMFYQDLIQWELMFLFGFTFLSTFLGQVADFMTGFFPDPGDALLERLRNDELVGKKELQYKKKNEEGIEKLQQLVDIMDDDDLELVTQRVTRIRVKKNLLVLLLYETKRELEHYKKRGERYENLSYAKTCQEENMLNEVLYHTTREREKLETYGDEGRSSTVSPDDEYFADGTSDAETAKKLKLKRDRFKKNLPASHYI